MNALAHYLFPGETNNYKARILHPIFLFLASFAIIISQFGVQFLSSKTVGVLGYAANISTDEVVRLTNLKRADFSLPSLDYSSTLAEAAAAKGRDMLENNYWSHVSPDGTEPWSFFISAGYNYKYAGENLARDFSNPQSAVDAWMASPSHKENILSPRYKEIGIAVVEGDMNGVDTTIIVQLFGTQLADVTPTVPVAAASEEESVAPQVASVQTPAPATLEPIDTGSVIQPPTVVQAKATPLDTTKYISAIVIGFLALIMVVDFVAINRNKVARISGKSFAHLSFLGMLMIIVLIITAGNIL